MPMVTCIAPVNIAVIKYWGKRDEQLILPLNDSVSLTLDTSQMHAKTTVMISPQLSENKIWLNGKLETFDNVRLKTCIKEIQKKVLEEKGNIQSDVEESLSWKIHICSENNFPTAAGLASSAAGYACLVYCLGAIYGVKGDLSSIARLGSGSACRSVMGGFVKWNKGSDKTGKDSIAEQLFPASHWPSMRVVILVVNDNKKKTSSSTGMQRSVLTSELLKHRVEHCVPQRTCDIIKAISDKDFEKFAEISMKDSNQFHCVCLDTYPPAVYMNDVSHAIVDFVHAYNKHKGSTKLAYTFDAGPNACLLLEEDNLVEVLSIVKQVFPPEENGAVFFRGLSVKLPFDPPASDLNLKLWPMEKGCLKYVIVTKVGDGPHILDDSDEHLLDSSGNPKKKNQMDHNIATLL